MSPATGRQGRADVIAVTLQYVDDCPNRRNGRDRLQGAIDRVGRDRFEVNLRLIASHEQALAEGFRGSPSFLVDGRDLFADHDAPVGLTCRRYPTPQGLAGIPTLEQLVGVLDRTLAGGAPADG